MKKQDGKAERVLLKFHRMINKRDIIACLLLAVSFFFVEEGYARTLKADSPVDKKGSRKARAFYLDSEGGNDLNNGASPDSAWKTISKINGLSLIPGDKVLLKRGSFWREQLTVTSSGTAKSPIVFDAYGEGELPIICGSDNILGKESDWENKGGNIWARKLCVKSNIVLFNDKDKGIMSAKLNAPFNWNWKNGTFYVCSDSNPAKKYGSIEAAQRDHSVRVGGNNIVFNNIEGKIVNKDIWSVANARGLVFNNIKGSYTDYFVGDGFSAHNRSTVVVNKGEFHHCRRGLTNTHKSVSKNNNLIIYECMCGIYSGMGNHEYNQCIITKCGNAVVQNGNATQSFKRSYIFNNGAGISLKKDGCMSIEYCIINNNGKYGFSITDGKADILNCVFFGNKIGIKGIAGRSLTVKNTIFCNNSLSFLLKKNLQSYSGNNNLFFSQNKGTISFCDKNYPLADFSGYRKKASPNDENSICRDPCFSNRSGTFEKPEDFVLKNCSPCIHGGTNVGLSCDFAGKPLGKSPNIGAFE